MNNKLLTVIHIESIDQAVRNALLAKEHGADGCFLIHHHGDREELIDSYHAVRSEVGEWWVGINDLGRNGNELLDGLPKVDGIWVDDIEVNKDLKYDLPAETLLFGGTAFKYQKQVSDYEVAAKSSTHFCDVITTSGSETGSPPTVEKIQKMKSAIGDFPLAIASGITPENVVGFLEYTSFFLVATGISRNFHELDAEKIRAFVKAINATCK